jgi:NADH:ubiquinone oxidoreductase subunit 2 (subunit N)
MAGSKRFDIRSNEAGFKYFLMGSFASGFYFLVLL